MRSKISSKVAIVATPFYSILSKKVYLKRKMNNKKTNNEKRTDPRIDTAFIVKCMELSEKKNSFYTVIKDLSSGGIKILCEEILPLGMNFKIDINLIQEKAEACAEVVWYYKIPASERYCVGLKFRDVNEHNRRKLGDLIDTIYYSAE